MKRIFGKIGVLSTLAVLISAGACATIEAHTPPITDAGGKAIAGSLNTSEELVANFVLAHWDQRGAGESFCKDLSADEVHLVDFVDDTLEPTDMPRERFDA